jgi:hypothetical protein
MVAVMKRFTADRSVNPETLIAAYLAADEPGTKATNEN